MDESQIRGSTFLLSKSLVGTNVLLLLFVAFSLSRLNLNVDYKSSGSCCNKANVTHNDQCGFCRVAPRCSEAKGVTVMMGNHLKM